MKHSNNGSNARKKLQEKGYYIVLFLCVLAVGISGYLFVSTATQNRQEAALSIPLTAEKLPEGTPGGSAPVASAVEELSPEEKDAALRDEARKLAVAPLRGEVLRPFSLEELSYNETTKDWRLHDAVDILSAGGEVVACMAGTVTEVTDDAFFGTTVVIAHDGGYETRYSNLTAMPVVKVGDRVSPGSAIGAVGQTAMAESADDAHLHFQVLLKGQPVDPAEFLN